ncbi:MAG: hypothetical protein Q9168_001454 [Polycauliona sp. 1 TL-2023]
MNPPKYPASSATPKQDTLFRHGRSISNEASTVVAPHRDVLREGLQAPFRDGREARSMSNANPIFGPRGSSLAQGPPPGSFSSDLKTMTMPRNVTPRTEQGPFFADYGPQDDDDDSELRQMDLRDQISKETKIKIGSENLLEALTSKNARQARDQRTRVEAELGSSNRKIMELTSQLEEEIGRSKRPRTPSRNRLSAIFHGSPMKPSQGDSDNTQDENPAVEESESPTFALSEILQALETGGLQPDYYIERANRLVDLLKKYPSLKYDLVWPIFGLRVQTMLLSQSREVVAAGYRVTRHAITDRRSLQTIRRLNTDELVMLSLVKESKANIEREQALKFVRAFLDVKGGIHEMSNIVLRTIVAIAEHHEDRLRNISILTLLELLVRSPAKVVDAGGMASLTQALLDGSYPGSESLASAILFLFDKPKDRRYLKSCHELDAAFTVFTDPLVVHSSEEKLKASASVIIALLQSWPGLYSVSNDGFSAIKSLLLSLAYPSLLARDLILDIINAILQIKAPSWSSAFLAGRRLTTYGRVANLNKEALPSSTAVAPEDGEESRISLNEHYLALLLAVLIQSGLPQILSSLIQEEAAESGLRRKATLLHGEMLNLANRLLPQRYSASLQVLSQLVDSDDLKPATMSVHQISMTYQIDSVSRTLYRSRAASQRPFDAMHRSKQQSASLSFHSTKHQIDYDMDELKFRAAIVETQILNHANFLKWDWNMIEEIIEGPLKNPKRLNEAINGTKFLKRLLGFYRPFKYRFSAALNTKLNQRYVRAGVSLMKVLLQSNDGIAYLRDSKFLRQLGECLSQIDKTSGFFADEPLFSHWRTSSTLTGGYFSLLGALSSDPKGLQMFERWHMINISYHILDLRDRDDLVELLLGNMDFTLDSHLRVMLSKALTASHKHIRIFATNLLRKYAVQASRSETDSQSPSSVCEWAIRLLVTQLYDPEVEVSEVAVQILEESCRWKSHLEYVVRCRPQLDHLNNIGAPLLLRFLSTSLGYQYLDRLDYITQEMDDWFLGRNNSYVTLVEASLNRGFSASLNETPQSHAREALSPRHPALPPHFYRELSRTKEGCVLLQESGHFDKFVATIHDTWQEHEDQEAITKLKGCLWAVGNIGSMELGASFLDDSDVVKWIVSIAEHSEVATLRGTAFFVLGLISRSLHGMEIITEHGWHTATDYYGRSIGYCLPSSLGVFFSIGSHPILTEKRGDQSRIRTGPPQSIVDKDPIHARILESVANTGNTVLTKKAAGELNTLKTHHLEAFSSVELYRKVRDMLGRYKFHLPVRRFVLDLFNRSVVREIVLDEEESENESIQTERAIGSRPRLPLG